MIDKAEGMKPRKNKDHTNVFCFLLFMFSMCLYSRQKN